jgi:hypothetical protein
LSATYVTPDGRRFQADLDNRQRGEHRSWTLLPITSDKSLFRERLEQHLFVHRGRVVRLNFLTAALVEETGWTEADFRRDGP